MSAKLCLDLRGHGQSWTGRVFARSDVVDSFVSCLNLGEGEVARAELPLGDIGPGPRESCIGAFLDFADNAGVNEVTIDGTPHSFVRNEVGFLIKRVGAGQSPRSK